MNKLEIALQLIMNAVQSGQMESVSFYFQMAENIESEAISRRYIQKVICDECRTKIDTINLDEQFRVKCDCKNGIGTTYEDAYQDWSSK